MIELLKEYGTKRLELLKLDMKERGVVAAGTLTFIILIAIFGVFFLILFNIGLAIWLGSYLHNYAYGFLSIAGFYFIILIGVIIFGKKIKDTIANKLLKSLDNPKHE